MVKAIPSTATNKLYFFNMLKIYSEKLIRVRIELILLEDDLEDVDKSLED